MIITGISVFYDIPTCFIFMHYAHGIYLFIYFFLCVYYYITRMCPNKNVGKSEKLNEKTCYF